CFCKSSNGFTIYPNLAAEMARQLVERLQAKGVRRRQGPQGDRFVSRQGGRPPLGGHPPSEPSPPPCWYPAETTEAFCDGHIRAFAFFGGVPQSILYDNTKIAVARILGDGKRQRTRVFTELQSHYLFEDRFGRPGKGNDKGKVEGLVGYARRNFLVPIPVFESFEALN